MGVLTLIFGWNLFLFFRDKKELIQEVRDRWRQFLVVEAFGLVFFIAFLLVRLGNPDLWHPAKGGEKPMDFSYFNAILKSTTFPPYDPWFAGGYINYYYYGFVLVGVLVKLSGYRPGNRVQSGAANAIQPGGAWEHIALARTFLRDCAKERLKNLLFMDGLSSWEVKPSWEVQRRLCSCLFLAILGQCA